MWNQKTGKSIIQWIHETVGIIVVNHEFIIWNTQPCSVNTQRSWFKFEDSLPDICV